MNSELQRRTFFTSPHRGEVGFAASRQIRVRARASTHPYRSDWTARPRQKTRIAFRATHSAVILRSRALARRLEGWPLALVAHPSRLAEDGEHLGMTAVRVKEIEHTIDRNPSPQPSPQRGEVAASWRGTLMRPSLQANGSARSAARRRQAPRSDPVLEQGRLDCFVARAPRNDDLKDVMLLTASNRGVP